MLRRFTAIPVARYCATLAATAAISTPAVHPFAAPPSMLRPTSVLLAPAKKGAKAAAPRGRPAKNKRTVSPSKTAKPKRARPSKKVEPAPQDCGSPLV